MRVLYIALGGALGTSCRYGVGLFTRNFLTKEWPLGTLVVNVLGCFLLAMVMEVFNRGVRMNEDLREAVTIGFCGGLTTYSSFNWDATSLFRTTSTYSSAIYLVATLVLCGLAGVAGILVGRALSPLSPA